MSAQAPERSGRHLSIGEVLSRLRGEFPDITISKIRFLESQGLIDPERTPSGYRKFYAPDLSRLRWILFQQRDHFLPLRVIKERLDAFGPNGAPTSEPANGETTRSAPEAPARPAPTPDSRPAVVHRDAPTPAAPARAPERAEPRRLEPEPEILETPIPAFLEPEPPDDLHPEPDVPVRDIREPELAEPEVREPDVREQERPAPSVSEPAPPSPAPPQAAPPGSPRTEPGPPRTEPGPPRTEPGPPRTEPGPPRTEPGPPRTEPAPPKPAPAPVVRREPVVLPFDDFVNKAEDDDEVLGPVTRPDDQPTTDDLTRAELLEATGLSDAQLDSLEEFGIVAPVAGVGERALYDESALDIAEIAAGFHARGIEARHLKMYWHFAEREGALFAQVLVQYVRQRNPAARARMQEDLEELARLGRRLRSEMLRRALGNSLGE